MFIAGSSKINFVIDDCSPKASHVPFGIQERLGAITEIEVDERFYYYN